MQHYLFVVKGSREADLDADTILRARVEEGRWPLNKRTSYRGRLDAGDRVVFYVAGSTGPGQSFLGKGVLDAPAQESRRLLGLSREARGRLAPTRYFVAFQEASVFDEPVSIRPLIPDLDFITSKQHWGVHVMGGVVKITEDDFDLIVRAASENQT